MLKLIFCNDPLQTGQPDSLYADEAEAAVSQGFEYALLNFEALVNDHNLIKAVQKIPAQISGQAGLYRGWMLQPSQYAQLYHGLGSKGITLLNDPAAYNYCHYLPNFYELIREVTPLSVWLKTNGDDLSFDDIMKLLEPFGSKPLIVKDFVKSRKHEWYDACYIPSAANRTEVERVVGNFVQRQGADLNEGLVFREFVEFEAIGTHPKSEMPLTREYRLFFLDHELLWQAHYWESGNYAQDGIEEAALSQFIELAKQFLAAFLRWTLLKRWAVNGWW